MRNKNVPKDTGGSFAFESEISGAILEFSGTSDYLHWHTVSSQGRNNYCKTNPDARFMHMKDDHMCNAQLKPGYNVQIPDMKVKKVISI